MNFISIFQFLMCFSGTAGVGFMQKHDAHNGASGSFSFASYYGDHMVLQQTPHRPMIWGYADREELGHNVTVIVASSDGDYSRIYEALVDIGPFTDKLIWSVQLDPRTAGGPYMLNATLQKKTITLSDIMFGDVWLCSGQSNMQFTVPMMSCRKMLGTMMCTEEICIQTSFIRHKENHPKSGVKCSR